MFEPSAEDNEILAHSESVLNRIFGDAHKLKEDDENEFFDPTVMQALGEEGLCGITTAEAHGGFGRGYYTYALVLEAIAKRSASYAVSVAVNGLPQMILQNYGNEAQRAQWMEPLATGGALGAFALSEPESGSDAASLQTTAIRDGSDYISMAGRIRMVAMPMCVWSWPEQDKLVPKGSHFGPKVHLGSTSQEEKDGVRASPTVELLLDNARIPAENLCKLRKAFGCNICPEPGRITIGAIGVGLAICSERLQNTLASESSSTNRLSISKVLAFFLLIWPSRLNLHGCLFTRPQP